MSRPVYTTSIKLLFFALAVLLSCSSVFALDFVGPPVADLYPDQLKAGIDYTSSSVDLNMIKGKFRRYLAGVYSDSGVAIDFTIEDFEVQNTYVELGYGLDYTTEIFIRMGSSSAQFDQYPPLGTDFDSDATPALGGGIKTVIHEEYGLRLGALAQINWANYSGKITEPDVISTAEMELIEIQVAAGATYMLTEGFWIYGGPFYYKVMGDFNYIYDSISSDEVLTSEYSYDVEEDSSFGGFIGAEYMLAENCSLYIEYQRTGAADAFGASFIYRF